MKKTIYLYKSGELIRKNGSIVLKNNNGVIYLPIEQIDIIICFGEISLNKRLLALLNTYKISILFFNFYGDYIGKYTPKQYINGKILLLQVDAYMDTNKRSYIATQILKASFHNMLSLMKYYNKKGIKLNKQISLIMEIKDKINDFDKVDSMMLLEAKVKQIYYSSFDVILANEKRSLRPPQNEVNAMLSYGYSILYGMILSILERSSLHPQISFIHSLNKSFDSLQYDLADIFKPVLIDKLVLRLIRRKRVKETYFDKSDGRCYLNKEGISFFVKEIENQLISTICYRGKNYSYKSLLSRDIHSLSKYIKKEDMQYKPYTMQW